MATFRRLPSGLWQVQVFRRGIRRSSSFPSKGAAIGWAGQQENEIMAGVRGEIPNLTVSALLTKYKTEVSRDKKGRRWEEIRLDLIGRDRLAQVRLRQLDAPHVSDWQERRLQAVSAASVRRERNLLNNVFEIARKEWRWVSKNPFDGVRRPKDGKPRNRIASPAEVAKLTAHRDTLSRVITFAIETGTRAGEIAGLKEITGRVAKVDGKTGPRDVALSPKALEVWEDGGFKITAGSISTLFARRCTDLEIEGLTFHDLRHTAATRLSKKLDALELAKMLGWRDLRILLNVYYKHDPEDTAKKL